MEMTQTFGDDPKFVLATSSRTRIEMLRAAGLSFITQPADIDERSIAADPSIDAGNVEAAARVLAREKSLAVGRAWPGRLVVGVDQTLGCEGKSFNKPPNVEAAAAQIAQLEGKAHSLFSAVSVTRDGAVLFEHTGEARMHMSPLSVGAINRYLNLVGSKACASVGGYQLEGLGIQLFERIEGDHFTILGLPLLPLLGFLRSTGLRLP